MRKTLFALFFTFSLTGVFSQTSTQKIKPFKPIPYKGGEWLRYKMSYSGFLKAGSAILHLREEELNGKTIYHAVGKGWTSGMISWFFKVDDLYESYFPRDSVLPFLFKRNVNEGGYIIRRDIQFKNKEQKAIVQDLKKDTITEVRATNVQDMISAFYYLREHDVEKMTVNEEVQIDMFFDGKTNIFKLRYLGDEILRTRFGKVKTHIFRPIVQSGRVFAEEESVTIWVTADDNKIPIKLKASLAVGSLRADLQAYKGLANSFEIIFD